jgi:hypothetical protein
MALEVFHAHTIISQTVIPLLALAGRIRIVRATRQSLLYYELCLSPHSSLLDTYSTNVLGELPDYLCYGLRPRVVS